MKILNRLLAFVLSLALTVAAVMLAVEVIGHWVGAGPAVAAHVRVSGTPTDPGLDIAVRTTEDADLVRLRHRIETEPLAHAREALDTPRLPIRLNPTTTDHRSSRVS